MSEEVLEVLGPGEKMVLGVLVAMTKGSQKVIILLYLPLRLGLGMVSTREADNHT